MEPEYVAEEMECVNSGNGREKYHAWAGDLVLSSSVHNYMNVFIEKLCNSIPDFTPQRTVFFSLSHNTRFIPSRCPNWLMLG